MRGGDPSSWAGGVSEALKSWGQGALITAGITVGGIVGVSGTLALQPGGTVKLEPGAEVAFRKDDMDLLRKGIPVTVSPGLEELLNRRAEDLAKPVYNLSNALKQGSATEPGLSSKVQELADAVVKLTKALPPGIDMTVINARLSRLEIIISKQGESTPDRLSAEVGEIKKLIGDIRGALVDAKDFPRLQLVADRLDLVGKRLDQVDGTLRGLDDTITKIGPRRNIRGGAEGGPR